MNPGTLFLVCLYPEPTNKGLGSLSLSRDGDANFFGDGSKNELTPALKHARVTQITALGVYVAGYEEEKNPQREWRSACYQEWFCRYEIPDNAREILKTKEKGLSQTELLF